MVFEELMTALEAGDPMALVGMAGAILLLAAIIAIPLYIYTSIAVMTIGRRLKVDYPGLAWIPGLGTALVFRKIAKMHWWPFLLLGGFLLAPLGIFGVVLAFIGMLGFAIFNFIWYWKTAEARNFPGWTVLLTLIPFWGLGGLWNLVLLGILAWRKE